jgi:hypothetical protein
VALTPQDPAAHVFLLPLAVAAVSTGAIRLVGGRGRGSDLANAAIPIGLLGAALILLGVPAFPPQDPLDKLFWALAPTLVLGTVLDLRRPRAGWVSVFVVAWSAATLAWIAVPRLGVVDSVALAEAGGLYAGALWSLLRLQWMLPTGLAPAIMTFSGALGVGGISALGGGAGASALAFALAGATAGFVLWNWPVSRYPFGMAALFGGAGALPLLAGYSLLSGEASPLPLALVLLVFLADVPAGWIKSAGSRAVMPLALLLVSLLPVAAALAFAYAARHGAGRLW